LKINGLGPASPAATEIK